MTDQQSRLRIVPCSMERAIAYVDELHRHHGAALKAKFVCAVIDEADAVRGVAMVGRPVARLLDDGITLEVNRIATDGCENACSALYGASRRIAKAMGYHKLITYIRSDEPGTSLKASGWTFEERIRARSWDMPGRHRTDKTEIVQRERWSVILNPTSAAKWPTFESDHPNLFVELAQ